MTYIAVVHLHNSNIPSLFPVIQWKMYSFFFSRRQKMAAVNILVAALLFHAVQYGDCMCELRHPQQQYCESDFGKTHLHVYKIFTIFQNSCLQEIKLHVLDHVLFVVVFRLCLYIFCRRELCSCGCCALVRVILL